MNLPERPIYIDPWAGQRKPIGVAPTITVAKVANIFELDLDQNYPKQPPTVHPIYVLFLYILTFKD